MGDLRAELFGGPVVQLAIGQRMRAIEQGRRQRAVLWPIGPTLGMTAIDAAHGQHHHRRAAEDGLTGRLIDGAGTADLAGRVFQPGHPMPVQQGQASIVVGAVQGRHQAAHQFTRGAPDHVVARQAVAVAIQAALHPVHRRHELDAFVLQPVIHLTARMLDVVARPVQRPFVLRVQLAELQPVMQGSLWCVRDTHGLLQRRADQGHAAKGP